MKKNLSAFQSCRARVKTVLLRLPSHAIKGKEIIKQCFTID